VRIALRAGCCRSLDKWTSQDFAQPLHATPMTALPAWLLHRSLPGISKKNAYTTARNWNDRLVERPPTMTQAARR